MAEAERKGHAITFDVLYYAQSKGRVNRMAEIGEILYRQVVLYYMFIVVSSVFFDSFTFFFSPVLPG